ncbi:hypothetical protein ABW21_db0204275 [Orbilia brochopaga]|nr:hypothetical protein ABW21_db0204275 [Drechslerella brochopaga]
MSLGTRIILHGKKPNHPFDNPKTEFWGNVAAMGILDGLPDAEKDSSKIGCLYNRYRYLREDYETDGTIPKAGGPQDPTNIIEQEYPQSMISLVIDENGQGLIHVGNRPNSIWTVNGTKVTQSELIDRSSHVTYLYGNSKHWLWLRRFATCESNTVQMEVNVPGDINTYRRPTAHKKRDDAEQAILIFPETTYLDSSANLRKLTYNMGHDTPHFHHHHRPRTTELSQQEKYLWNSQVRDLFLCQNPACFQLAKRAGDKTDPKANFTNIPCFEPTCVNNLPETQFYGNVTCTDPVRQRCLSNTDGQLRSHLPGIPGHMFLETGVLLFQPELIITNSEGIMNASGVNIPKPTGDDVRSKIPQPPLQWSRISFTAVKRFPSVSEARRFIRAKYNYDPIILAANESMGIAYDITMYERLNYYRLLFWNQLDGQMQRNLWTQKEDQRTKAGLFSTYSVSAHSDTSLRLGYQAPQDRYTSGTASAREGTDGASGTDSQMIVGTGESWVWDLTHGHLPPGSLPLAKAPEGSGESTQTGSANAANYVSAGKTATRSTSDMRNLPSTWAGFPVAMPETDRLAWIFGNNQRLQPVLDAEKLARMEMKPNQIDIRSDNGMVGIPADQDITLRSTDIPGGYSSYMKINLSDPNSDLHIGAHDKLLPKVFCRPVPGGMVREECIQITKPDMTYPILVRVKQTFLQTDTKEQQSSSVQQSNNQASEGSASMDIATPEPAIPENKLVDLIADEIYKTNEQDEEVELVEKEKQEAHVLEQQNSGRPDDQIDELANVLDPHPSLPPKDTVVQQPAPASSGTLVHSPVNATSERAEGRPSSQENEKNDDAEIPKNASQGKNPKPPADVTARPLKNPVKPKRTIEEVTDPVAPPKKKPGRKKKVQPEDLPYTNKDNNEEILREDAELDDKIEREATGRRKKGRQAAKKVAYHESPE